MSVSKIKKISRFGWLACLVLGIFAGLLLPPGASAQGAFSPLSGTVVLAFTWLVNIIVTVCGWLIAWAVGYLISLSQYNNFIYSPVVLQGWNVIRDLSNMFFVLALLIISFGTILHIEQYQLKRLLPKVLLMAILVNFSKAIAGLLIDFSQVIMLTFVAAFASVGEGNFLTSLRLPGLQDIYFSPLSKQTNDVSNFTIAGTYVFLLLMSIVALVVVIAFVLILVVRIVMLWILVIFSPFAYALSILPIGQQYAKQWWDSFSKYVTVGPVIAFFLWLSLSTLPTITSSDTGLGGGGVAVPIDSSTIKTRDGKTLPQVGATQAGSPDQMAGFIISSAMLLASLMFAQQVGGAVGKIAGDAYSKVTSGGAKVALAPFRGAAWLGGKGGKWALRQADDAQARLQQRFFTNTRLGQDIIKSKTGKKYGLSGLQQKGIQLRTLSHAWEERSKRVERKRLAESGGVANDVMSRVLSGGKDKTTEALEEARRLENEEQKGVTVVSNDKEHLMMELMEILEKVTTADGREILAVRETEKKKAAGIFYELTKNHDLNEAIKQLGLGEQYDMAVTPDAVQNLLTDLIGRGQETQDVNRIGFTLQEIGFANTDAYLKGGWGVGHDGFEFIRYEDKMIDKQIQESNPGVDPHHATDQQRAAARTQVIERAKDNRKLMTEEEAGRFSDDDVLLRIRQQKRAETTAAFVNKQTFRSIFQNRRAQDFFHEYSDGEDRVFGDLNETGKMLMKETGAAMAKQFDNGGEEIRKALRERLDILTKYFEDYYDSMEDAERINVATFIAAVAGNKSADRDAVSRLDVSTLNTQISNNVPDRNDAVVGVNAGRQANAAIPASRREINNVTLQPVHELWVPQRPELYGANGRVADIIRRGDVQENEVRTPERNAGPVIVDQYERPFRAQEDADERPQNPPRTPANPGNPVT